MEIEKIWVEYSLADWTISLAGFVHNPVEPVKYEMFSFKEFLFLIPRQHGWPPGQ